MRRLTPLAAAVAVLGLSASAWAQTAAPQRVEITGSSIKRIADEGALPVQVITRQDLERQGIVTAEQLISTLSSNGSGLDNLAANSDVVAGARRGVNGMSCANLRMQGCEATLILLNGRRVAAYGLSGGIVDVQSIPMAAVERVEVLKDGASAIYGTDAIGGVINFILRKDYQGLEAQAFTDVTQHGGGNINRVKLAGGFGDLERDGFNVLAAISRSENKALRGDQRDFVNTFQPDRGLSVDTRGTPIATLFTLSSLYTALSRDNLDNTGRNTGPKLPGGTQAYNGINILDLPGGAGCDSVDGMDAYDEVLWATPAARFGCAWDTGRAAVLQQPVTNTNAVLRGTLRLGEHQVYGEFTGAKVESKKSFSPNQISSSAAATSVFRNLAYPSTGASYDGVFNALVGTFPQLEPNRGQPLAFRWRCMPCGDRAIDTESESSRFLIAADGPIAGDWSYRAGASRATSKSTSVLAGGYFYGREFADLINTGVLDPFSLTQTSEALAALQSVMANGATLYGGKYVLEQVDATFSGPIARLPGGEVMLAVGADLRREKYRFNGNETDLATQARIFNAPFDSTNTLAPVKRDVKAVYAEVQVPVTKQLELNVAARHDDYSGFGGTTNPKATLLFKPTEQVALRASYGEGFRVPTFSQLFFGVTESPYSGKDMVDPAKCASGVVSATPGCEQVTPTILTGGKTNLGPERSKQWTAGIVWEPSANFNVSVDYWDIKRNGTVQSLSLADLIKNYNLFPGNFIRDASGNLEAIDNRWVNAGETATQGIDINARLQGRLTDARWSVVLDGSYLLKKKSRLISSAPFGASEVGVFTRSGDLGLRWKHALTGTYTRGPWTAMLQNLYRSGYTDRVLPGVANGSVVPPNWNPKVKAYQLWNASLGYAVMKNLNLTVGVRNLLDKDPPFSAAYDDNTGAGSSWEPRVADPRGRSFMLQIDYKFF
ncbi:MAG: TonB-dependent receptor [Burkholderiales bacterium]|nr:TonB-dependent receptor [Burkholderiales bacterium]